MGKEIDVRGLSCPQPLIIVKKEVDAGGTELSVTADDAVKQATAFILGSLVLRVEET